jgi:hypothetical protein
LIFLKNTDLQIKSFSADQIRSLIWKKNRTVTQYYSLYLIEIGFSIFLKFYLLNLLSENDFGQLLYAIAIISIFDSILDLLNSEYYQKIMENLPIKIFSGLIVFGMASAAISAVIAWGVVVSSGADIESNVRNLIMILMLLTMFGKYLAFQPYLSLQARHKDKTIFYVELAGLFVTLIILLIFGASTLLSAFIIFILQQNLRNMYFLYAYTKST